MYAIGFDVGGTNIKITAVSTEGDRLFTAIEPTDEDRVAWAERLLALLARIEAEQGKRADAVGLAAPGLAARDGLSIAWMQGRMASIQGLDWTRALDRDQPVPVLNDAHAALMGESWLGSAAGCRDVILLTLGTGVGGGALVDGRLLTGNIGRGGHLGHLCLDPDAAPDITGTPGSLEDAIGDCTILARTNGRFASTAALVEAHLAGDTEASATWRRALWQLACGLNSLINVLDPEVAILGGGIAKAGSALFEPVQDYLNRIEWRPTGSRVRLVPAALGEMAGAVGAAYNALRINGIIEP